MKRLKAFWKEEKAAAQMMEALLLYPIVFLIIFLMFYLGLYILQSVSLGTYAQKTALLASRELSQPGYRHLISSSSYSTGAVEMDGAFQNSGASDAEHDGDTVKLTSINMYGKEMTDHIGIAYRFFIPGRDPLTADGREYYETILKDMVKKTSVLQSKNSNNAIKVNVTCENKIIAQYVHVSVEQELVHFPILDFFGVEPLTVSASAVATVSDTDELVRTTDFVADAISSLVQRLGIKPDKLRSSVNNALETLGLK